MFVIKVLLGEFDCKGEGEGVKEGDKDLLGDDVEVAVGEIGGEFEFDIEVEGEREVEEEGVGVEVEVNEEEEVDVNDEEEEGRRAVAKVLSCSSFISTSKIFNEKMSKMSIVPIQK